MSSLVQFAVGRPPKDRALKDIAQLRRIKLTNAIFIFFVIFLVQILHANRSVFIDSKFDWSFYFKYAKISTLRFQNKEENNSLHHFLEKIILNFLESF